MGRNYSSRRKGSRFPFSPSRREAECRPSSFHKGGKKLGRTRVHGRWFGDSLHGSSFDGFFFWVLLCSLSLSLNGDDGGWVDSSSFFFRVGYQKIFMRFRKGMVSCARAL